MRTIRSLALGTAGLFLALTYLLIRGDAPDAALHQRTLGALDAVVSPRRRSSAMCSEPARACSAATTPSFRQSPGFAATRRLRAAAGVASNAAARITERYERLMTAVNA